MAKYQSRFSLQIWRIYLNSEFRTCKSITALRPVFTRLKIIKQLWKAWKIRDSTLGAANTERAGLLLLRNYPYDLYRQKHPVKEKKKKKLKPWGKIHSKRGCEVQWKRKYLTLSWAWGHGGSNIDFSLHLSFLLFYWSTVCIDLQCHVSSRCTAQWFIYIYVCIYIYIYIYVCIYIYTYIHTHTHKHTPHIYIYIFFSRFFSLTSY